MWTTINDVYTDYQTAMDAAGVDEGERLSRDAVRDICHEHGRYEAIDEAAVMQALTEATSPELARVMYS
jgi:hypothetical protein